MSKRAASTTSDTRTFPPIPLGKRNSDASTNRERRFPANFSRIRKRNPFSANVRNNFPDIDEMFKSMTVSSSDMNDGDSLIREHLKKCGDDDADEIFCQNSDVDESSVLNMSIGARAALNEHARYIAKFGIDGEINIEMEPNNSSSSNSDETNSEVRRNKILDDQWERLLDESRADSEILGSSSEDIPPPPNSTIISFQPDSYSLEKSNYEESSIEVMTDVSYDFFNSSRVNLLVTPERNRNRPTEMVMTRDKLDFDDSPSDGQISYHNENDDENNFGGKIHQEIGRNELDLHCSFDNIGDISRISNNTHSDTTRLPDASFESYRRHCDKRTDGDISTTMFGLESPSMILNDSSFLSGPNSNFELGNNGKSVSYSGSPSTCQSRLDRENFSDAKNRATPGESESSEKSVHSSSSIQSAVSNFITEAYTFTKQIVNNVEKSIEGMESLPADFLRSMEISQTDAPSPISDILSNRSTPSHHNEASNERRNMQKSSNDFQFSNNGISTNEETKNRFASSAVGDTIQIHLTGRKRFRTVVPRRVYLDLPTQRIDEEQDSFVAVQSDPEPTRVGISLLESFEDAAVNNTF